MATRRTLSAVLAALRKRYGKPTPPPTRDPFELVLWEQVAYLVDDDVRLAAFQLLKRKVGLAPAKIARARIAVLEEVARAGGAIGYELRAERMRSSAQAVLDDWGGDLSAVLELPPPKALRALTKFPMIGKPGAEKILLFTGTWPVLALESNGLRTLLRLGYGHEGSGYDQTYRAVREATEPEELNDPAWLAELHVLLRRHGQQTCRNSKPACDECVLATLCERVGV